MIPNVALDKLPSIDVTRELLHGTWTVLALLIGLLCARYLVCKWLRFPRVWRTFVGVQLAAGTLFFMAASFIRAGGEWALMWHENRGDDLQDWRFLQLLLLIAGPIVFVGGCCIARVLSREVWGHWVWITMGIFAIVIPVAVHYL